MNRYLSYAFFCLIAFSSSQIAAREDQAKQPNIVILFADDQGTPDANCCGSADLFTATLTINTAGSPYAHMTG